MSNTLQAQLFAGRRLLPYQHYFLTHPAWIKVLLGTWGSAKTTTAALTFAQHCFRNPWREEVHGSKRPFSIVTGLTWRVLRDTSQSMLREVLPKQLIVKENKSDEIWTLANGHEVYWRPVSGAMEGVSSTGVWIDEAHLVDREVWRNYKNRVRDSDARAASRLILASGLPWRGWLDEEFGRPEHALDPERLVLHVGMKDNPALPEAVVRQLRSGLTSAELKAADSGDWISAASAVFLEFDPTLHIVADRGDRNAVTHLAVDVGDQGAILFAQKKSRTCRDINGKLYQSEGLHVVDEMHPRQVSTEAALREAVKRGWRINAESVICVDPRTSIDQIDGIRRVLGPNVSIIRKQRGQYGYEVEDGIRAVRAALRDVDKNVRLTFSEALPRDDDALLTRIPKARRRDDGKNYVKDQKEHVLDALRYLTLRFLPQRGSVAGPTAKAA